ncbi:flagellin [Rhizosaccharibacter radicis]|uniref:Flagellin n=1 Tax=Rhizosaccharibacter radicis TaxID=2782605 RepID=A0ABT1VSA1_9PROT|nr:flagellin [Acetobacteraceae bacterium KSS12]
MTLSINTNTASMAALESLSKTTKALNDVQNQVSTGKKVDSAADNPAIYAIAQSMNGNIAGLSAVSDSLSLGAQVVNTASKASSDIISTLQTLQQSVTQAGNNSIDTDTMKKQVADAINAINSYARNSTFNGVNLLTSTQDTGGTATLNQATIVTGVSGTQMTIGNQAVAINNASNAVLTNALGLSNLTAGGTATAANQQVIGTAGAGQDVNGVSITTGNALQSTDFANNSTIQLTNKDGTTTTFEFVTSGTATTTADTTGPTANHTVAVTIDPTSQSANTIMGKLVDSMNANGYTAALQTDGSIDVVGNGVNDVTSSIGNVTKGANLTSSQAVVTTIQSAINKMTSISSTLGASTQQITGLQSFTSDLSDALTTGVGALTDADLSAASAKLTSLQTKQQLAIQSLSIANSQSQSIMSLFRG